MTVSSFLLDILMLRDFRVTRLRSRSKSLALLLMDDLRHTHNSRLTYSLLHAQSSVLRVERRLALLHSQKLPRSVYQRNLDDADQTLSRLSEKRARLLARTY